MTVSFAGVVADAWALFRRDADLLLRVAGPFLFLPAYALTMLVPPMPMPDAGIADAAARAEAWTAAVSPWVTRYGLGFLLAYVAAYFGQAVLMHLYVDRERPPVGVAMRRAAAGFPRFFAAMLLVSVPAGMGMWLLVLPGLYVLGRTLPTAPVLVAERPIGIGGAIGRALTLTRGNGLTLTGVAAAIYLSALLAGQPFLLIDGWMRGDGHANPLAIGLVDAAAAAVAMLAQLSSALVAIAAYRRLAR